MHSGDLLAKYRTPVNVIDLQVMRGTTDRAFFPIAGQPPHIGGLQKYVIAGFLGALVAGCANYNGATPPNGYSVLYDQGDQMKDLVAKQDYDGAASLFLAEESYFEQRADQYRVVLDRAALGINGAWASKLDGAVQMCASIVWPTPRESWPMVSQKIKEERSVLSDYDAIRLTKGPRRSERADTLLNCITSISTRILADAPKIIGAEDLSDGKNLFDEFPVAIADYSNSFINRLKTAFDGPMTIEQLTAIAATYAPQLKTNNLVKTQFQSEAGELLKQTARRDGLAAVSSQFYKLRQASIAPGHVPITVGLAYLLPSPGSGTPSLTASRDVPFEWKDVPISDVKNGNCDSDFLVVVAATDASVHRKVSDYGDHKSTYLKGYRTVQNPDFERAFRDAERAGSALISAREMHPELSGSTGAYIILFQAQKNFNDAIERAKATPETVQVPIYGDYSYASAKLDLEKGLNVMVIIGRPSEKPTSWISKPIKEARTFDVAYNVREDDPSKSQILGQYRTEDAVDKWEQQELQLALSEALAVQSGTVEVSGWKDAIARIEQSQQLARATEKGARVSNASGTNEKQTDDRRFDSVVVIQTASALGSGFYVTPSLVITNAHVISGQKYVTMQTYAGEQISGKVVAEDRRRDLALVKIDGNRVPLLFGAGDVAVGSPVVVVGHPQGLRYSLTKGIVSQLRSLPPVSGIGGGLVYYIQLDAAISPGNSGGPVFQDERVVGIATWKVTAKGSENLNFAIHRDEIFGFLRENGVATQ